MKHCLSHNLAMALLTILLLMINNNNSNTITTTTTTTTSTASPAAAPSHTVPRPGTPPPWRKEGRKDGVKLPYIPITSIFQVKKGGHRNWVGRGWEYLSGQEKITPGEYIWIQHCSLTVQRLHMGIPLFIGIYLQVMRQACNNMWQVFSTNCFM